MATPYVKLVRNGKVTPAQAAVEVFSWARGGTTDPDRDLRLAKEAGFVWVKTTFAWRDIEQSAKNAYVWGEAERIVDAVNKAGLGLIVRITSQPEWARRDNLLSPKIGPPDKIEDWKDFVEVLAEHFKGKIPAYQIWSGPNVAEQWGDANPNPVAYTEMLGVAHASIKRADPDALVITADMWRPTEVGERAMPDTEFVRQMYVAGAKPYFDMLGARAIDFKAEPEADPADVAQSPVLTHNAPGDLLFKRAYAFRHVQDLWETMVKNGDEGKQIGIMQMGWIADPNPSSPFAWQAVSEEQKGDYLVRAFLYAKQNWSQWVGIITMSYLAPPDVTTNSSLYYRAVTSPDGSPRPAYTDLRRLLRPEPPPSPTR